MNAKAIQLPLALHFMRLHTNINRVICCLCEKHAIEFRTTYINYGVQIKMIEYISGDYQRNIIRKRLKFQR